MSAGSTFGNLFRITTWGESHGEAIGVVIDGCPAGLALDVSDIQPYLNRRKPGQSRYATPRKESDEVQILSGVFEGRTTGTPISLLVANTSQRSSDYSEIASYYRPGHADYTFDQKYGFRDYRGGGRSSGRETIGRVAAGAVALKILSELGVDIMAYTYSIGPVTIDESRFSRDAIYTTPTAMPDFDANQRAEQYLSACMEEHDSSGGSIKCRISGLPAGIGEPVFGKLDAVLSGALMSIGAVKAVEVGDGVRVSTAKGSENNDAFLPADWAECSKDFRPAADEGVKNNGNCKDSKPALSPAGNIRKASNHAGGTLGGISDGSDVLLTVHIKPTPSIVKEQQTVRRDGSPVSVSIKGRHDPIIVPRAVVVVESMCALSVLDLMLANLSAKMDNLKLIYH
ncbi:MAG: chorismate synthase [Clostridium sp.]|nr:chorismate synthase [Clostridium sp.]